MQLQFEDRVGLSRGERFFSIQFGSAAAGVDVDFLAAKIKNQIFASVGAVGAAPNNRDDIIEMIERGEITFEDVLAVFRLLQ